MAPTLPLGSTPGDVRRRIEAVDPGFDAISQHWGSALRRAFAELPDIVDLVR